MSVQRGRTTGRDTLNVTVFYQSRVVGDEILRQQQSSLRLEEGAVPWNMHRFMHLNRIPGSFEGSGGCIC